MTCQKKDNYVIEDKYIEREIVTCAIVHTEFYEYFDVAGRIKNIESRSAKTLLTWCLNYYNEYGVAPRAQIQSIFKEKNDNKEIDEEYAEWLSDSLEDLSDGQRDNVNPKAVADYANRYCHKLYLEKLSEELQQHAENGELEEANKLIAKYDPPSSNKKLSNFILPLDHALEYAGPAPKRLMGPWLRERSLTLIYGNTGAGKSWLAYMITKALTRKNFEEPECEIGAWQVRNPCKVLFVDGEVGPHDMGDSFNSLRMGPPMKGKEPIFISSPMMEEQGENPLDLTKSDHQQFILKILKNDSEIKVVILDNEINLFGKLLNENDNREWLTKVGNFIKRLRSKGVACVLIHDSGKSSEQRGASARAFIMNTIINMTSIKNMEKMNEVHTNIQFQKVRRNWGNDNLKPFSLHIVEDPEHRGFVKCYTDEIKCNNRGQQSKELEERQLVFILEGFLNGDSKTILTKQLGVSPNTMNKLLKTLKANRYIRESGQRKVNVTTRGKHFLGEVKNQMEG